MIDQKRMTYIPHPPSLKCFHAAAIERPPSGFSPDPLSAPPTQSVVYREGRRRVLLASELVSPSDAIRTQRTHRCESYAWRGGKLSERIRSKQAPHADAHEHDEGDR